jgi:hypothetical protein
VYELPTGKEHPVNYMLLIMGNRADDADRAPGDGATIHEFMAFDQAMKDAGIKVDGCALGDPETATTVQIGADGQRVVTNGPFAETREYVGGYVIIDVPDLDAAMDWAARCPGAKYGRVEVRPLIVF